MDYAAIEINIKWSIVLYLWPEEEEEEEEEEDDDDDDDDDEDEKQKNKKKKNMQEPITRVLLAPPIPSHPGNISKATPENWWIQLVTAINCEETTPPWN